MSDLVQKQFGANAASYASSSVHAKGDSLARLLALTQPQPDWHVLDVATGAGHTALAFAPYVAAVTAVDITPQMLTVAAQLAAERQITNIQWETAAAESLPFPDNHFHLVTCRIAPHHFDSIPAFLSESARVLRPGGLFAVVDNIVPGSRLRGKKANLQRLAGDYVNAFEKLRDPSHGRCLSLHEWQDALQRSGFTTIHEELLPKTIEFASWAARMQVSPVNVTRLQAMLLQAPEPARAFLTPITTGDRITFQLLEALLIGEKRD